MALFQNDVIYTVGPASMDTEENLFSHGASGVRLTFSFGTPNLQEERAGHARLAANEARRPCHVMADLEGEKFRLGIFDGTHSVTVKQGQQMRLVPAKQANVKETGHLPVHDPRFFQLVRKADQILIGDGAAILLVTDVDCDRLKVESLADGVIDQKRGLTVRGGDFQPKALTKKDRSALRHIADSSLFDSVIVSFVAGRSDVLAAKEIAAGCDLAIGAKIETKTGLENIEEIADAADFLVAARGDLALALPWVELPGAVDAIASTAVRKGIPWILATQVVEGLERFAIPTRAEICDLGHWLQRGAAGVVLCYETAFGRKPELAVSTVSTMIKRWQPNNPS